MSHNKRLTDERLKIWLDFWKWLISSIIITGVISIATIMINAKHKDTELEIKINQEEKEYLTSFLEKALDNNLEKRKRFAQYFASVTTSKKYQEGWKNYLNMINQEINDVKKNLIKEKKEIPNKSGIELEQAKKRIAALESELLRSKSNSTPCQQAEILTIINSRTERAYTMACSDMNGQWQLQTNPNNTPCQQAEVLAVIDGRTERTYTTVCRDTNNQWYFQYINMKDTPCQKAEVLAVIEERTERVYTTACRDISGRWQFLTITGLGETEPNT